MVASLNKNTLSRKLAVADKWQWSGSSSTAVTTENICTGEKKGGGGISELKRKCTRCYKNEAGSKFHFMYYNHIVSVRIQKK